MKRGLKGILSFLMVFMLCVGMFAVSGVDTVKAKDDVTTGSTEGTAYAILTGSGSLIFFRSNEVYSEGAGQVAYDINGTMYKGRIYKDIETHSAENWHNSKWYGQRTSIKNVRVADGQMIKPIDCRYWFLDCSNMDTCDLSRVDTSNVVNMESMFSGCSNLKNLNISGLNTSKVTYMNDMFSGCKKLKSLDLSSFDTSKVISMAQLLDGCSDLREITFGRNISLYRYNPYYFPTPSYTLSTGKWVREDGEYGPFTPEELCANYTSAMAGTWVWEAKELPYAVFDSETGTLSFVRAKEIHDNNTNGTVKSISGGEYTGRIFTVNESSTGNNRTWSSIASQVKKVVFVDEIKPKSTASWFYQFSNCTTMDLKKLNMSECTNMSKMFSYCGGLTSLDLSHFDTSKVTSFEWLFRDCWRLKSLNVSGWKTSNVKNMILTFAGLSGLKSLDVNHFDTRNVTDIYNCFYGDSGLTTLDLSNWKTPKAKSFLQMFISCSNLETLDISGLDVRSVTDMRSMFSGCSKLKSVKLSENFSFKGNNITNIGYQAVLPTPSSNAPYTGKWIRDDKAEGPFTPEQLRDNYTSAMAGTWVWEERDPNGYVVFDANGGGFTNGAVTKLTFAESEGISPFITLDEDVTKFPGRFLLGWSEDASATSPTYEPGVEINIAELEKTKTLYAIWTAEGTTRYHVEHQQQNYGLDGYTLTEKERLYGEAGSSVTPEVKSYDGFAVPSTQTVTLAADGSTVVTYKYDRLQYTVHFDGNGATSGQLADQKFLIGVGGTLRPNNYSKKGSIFTGWNTAPDGSGTSYTNGANVVDLTTEHGSTVTLYAQWLDNKDHATEPTDGAVRVTLKAGQTVVIPDLPAGTSYTIREVDNPQGWTFDHTDGETGTILANQTNSATVYNVYHAVGSIPLQINKELVDGLTGESKPIEAGKFTFALIKSDGSQIQLASNEATDNEKVIYDDEGNEVNNPNYGKAIVTFDPIAYDESDIGKTYTYRIGEVNTPEGYTASDPINVTVSIADAGQGQLDITAQYDNNQTITNTDNSGGKLEIKKLVSGSAPEGAEFTFKVDLTDETGKTYTDTVNGKKSDESNVSITSGETVSLHADESVVFNLPAGIGYTVSEQTQDGWTLVQSSGETGTIVSEQTSTATFTNAYNVEGTVTLEADKVLTGKDLTANEFTFEVLDADGNVVATGTNDADGKVSLVIPYTADDVGNTYEYTVHEVKPEGDTFGVTYDETIYGVSVAVSAEGGKIVGNVSITDADKMTFTNTYNAETDITVSGKKVLEGREFRDSDKWTFNLSSEDGPLPEETSVEISPINGDTFSFTIPFSVADMDGAQTKEFTYKVTESGSVLFVANDKSEKTFKVRVTDTKDGILKAELVDADNLDLTFTNKATVTLPATGSTTAIVLTIVGVVVIAGGLFFLLRKRKDDDEDE